MSVASNARLLFLSRLTRSHRRVTIIGQESLCRSSSLFHSLSSSSTPMIDRSQSGKGIVACMGAGRASSALSRLHVSVRVPTELWGAANALAAGLCSGPLRDDRGQAAQPLRAASDAAESSTLGMPPQPPQSMRERLDFRPALQRSELLACLLLPALACAGLYAALQPAALSFTLAAGMAGLYAALLAATRVFFLEQQYNARLVSEADLAEPDSRFKTLDGVRVHYKVTSGSPAGQQPELGVAMFHGFGANTFSWSFVDRLLAQRLQALVTSHDMPGFGLTQRSLDLKDYTLERNGRFGRLLLDAELAAAIGAGQASTAPKQQSDKAATYDVEVDAGASSSETRGRPRRVLIGHSMGGACAVAEVIENPEGVSALILVAPAVIAPRVKAGGEASTSAESGAEAGSWAPEHREGRPSRLRAFTGTLQVLAGEAAALFARCALWLLQPVLILALRSAVRSRAFWERGLGSAWFRKSGLSVAIVDAYRLPQLVRGWEMGLLRFVRARAAGGRNLWAALRSGYGTAPTSQAERLAQAVAKHNIKVFVVHGENDALVPAWNSRRLAALLPGAQLVIYPECGHLPMEELPQRFVEDVGKFVGTS